MILDSLPIFKKKILTCFRQESENEQYRNTVKYFLFPNTVSQKDKKPHTAGLDNTVIPTLKSKLPKYHLKKSLILQYRKPPCPSQEGVGTYSRLGAY